MADTLDPTHADELENRERLVELPPARPSDLLRRTGAGLAGRAVHGPGTAGLYRHVIVAEKPRP